MLAPVKQFLKSSAIWSSIVKPIRSEEELRSWHLRDRPVPPPHAVKVRNILCLADLFDLHVLIETGTFRGDMIAATKDRFRQIISFEVFEPLAIGARQRFRNDSNVEIIVGDSAKELPPVLERTPSPVIFWLDGHYSGEGTGKADSETPVLAELAHIHRMRQNFRDVIIIDDARAFGTEPDYPPLDQFLATIQKMFNRRPVVANDSIFIFPGERAQNSSGLSQK